jgi:hypothetical protein
MDGRILCGLAELLHARGTDIEPATMATMFEAAPVDAHPYGVRRAAKPVSRLPECEPCAASLSALGESLLNARLHKRLEVGMTRELVREFVEELVRPTGVHATVLAASRCGRPDGGSRLLPDTETFDVVRGSSGSRPRTRSSVSDRAG